VIRLNVREIVEQSQPGFIWNDISGHCVIQTY